MNHPWKPLFAILCVSLFLGSCRSSPPAPHESDSIPADKPNEQPADYVEIPPYLSDLPVSSFGEIWGYLVSGREETLKTHYPLSDVGYFGAEVDTYGKLTGVPDPKKIEGFPGRVHLVVISDSRALTHFVLEEGSQVRKQLIADLLEASRNFDGLQIDFELVPKNDGETFLSFLAELREGLGNKLFTIALPARMRTIQNDVYDYARIAPLVDRILVMAYDEHWSTSKPGPIASMEWCRSVAQHSLAVVGPEKLIMGLPFYGRTWGNVNTFRAFFFSGIERIKEENNVTDVSREDGIPTFTYEIPVTVTVYYEDDHSLSRRMEMYKGMGVQSIGFWSLGQESPTLWNILNLSE
ncbi:glycosyl hydrolase family 18 protein [Breznakiella homolactica]|uniref:Glycoside hydrolase n=1 Tax=Breznakiella homolactica TaxID=2798577 RepID=A0A7T7XLL0_9SPIR|nr:glycosyl hydrolase family 18 protein [Breznakiella homolactica]QQO08467.1 glycoside hydrolase [Breznakiella homolactica]